VRAILLAALALGLCAGTARAYSFDPIASGLVDPVYVTSAPGDASTLYVVGQLGTIQIVRDGRIVGTLLDITARVHAQDELGLLGMAFSPKYAQNHLYYIDYTDLNGDTHIVEINAATGVERELLFVDQPYPNHKGGQLAFDRGGLLYVGMGDGGTDPDARYGDPQNHAQDPGSKLGKLLRIDPAATADWQVVALGVRNPWRFSFDRATGDLWVGDVGAGTSEEIDRLPRVQIGKRANFGWSRFEGTTPYNSKIRLAKGKLVEPVWAYGHSTGGCSVIGGYVYRGSRVPAARGRYFFGDFCLGAVWTVRPGKRGVTGFTKLPSNVPNLVSFGEDANGELYAVGLDGVLYALRP
jgi:glucose/arabinose dehydrogenase